MHNNLFPKYPTITAFGLKVDIVMDKIFYLFNNVSKLKSCVRRLLMKASPGWWGEGARLRRDVMRRNGIKSKEPCIQEISLNCAITDSWFRKRLKNVKVAQVRSARRVNCTQIDLCIEDNGKAFARGKCGCRTTMLLRRKHGNNAEVSLLEILTVLTPNACFMSSGHIRTTLGGCFLWQRFSWNLVKN